VSQLADFHNSSNHLFGGTIQAWDIHWEDI
jgi:hypothetical protein